MDTDTAHDVEGEDKVEGGEGTQTGTPFDEEKFFQRMGSWTGRMIADQFDKRVSPVLEELKKGNARPPESTGNDLQDLMFSDPKKFLREGMKALQEEEKNTTEVKMRELDEAILGYAEEPLYREIHPDMKKIATDKMREGWPPRAAAEYAKEVAEKNHLSQSEDHEDLEQLGGGGKPPGKKKVSLSPDEKAASDRDIRDGIVKDEAEWIQIRESRRK